MRVQEVKNKKIQKGGIFNVKKRCSRKSKRNYCGGT